MALNPAALAADIKSVFQIIGAVDTHPLTGAPTPLDPFCLQLATKIIEHIQSNAVVTPTLLVAPSGGGPVTGTGTIA